MSPGELIKPLYEDYFASLLNGDRNRCRETVLYLLDHKVSVRELYEELFQRSMYEVGTLWETNRISVAVEHMATSVTESLIPLVHPLLFAASHCGKKAVVSCVANEHHQLGARMVADILELSGWDSYFLGANVPLPDLMRVLDLKRPDLLCLSLAVHQNYPKLLAILGEIGTSFPGLPVFVGGQAFNWGGFDIEEHHPQVRLVTSIKALEDRLAAHQEFSCPPM